MISSSMSPPYLPLVVCLSRHSSAHSIRRAQRYGVDEVSDVRSDGGHGVSVERRDMTAIYFHNLISLHVSQINSCHILYIVTRILLLSVGKGY